MQANTSLGPVYFTCYPNLELDCMNDQSIRKTLALNIHTQNYDMNPRSRNIPIVYRVYYKVMTFVVTPNCLLTFPKDQQILLEFVKGIELKEINQFQDKINLLQHKQHVKFL